VDNDQVAVFGALAKRQYAAPIDVRLHLPKKCVYALSKYFLEMASRPKTDKILIGAVTTRDDLKKFFNGMVLHLTIRGQLI
jgi:hypothetical protein